MIKISGRHKSVPKELKRALTYHLSNDVKIIMNDICSCRHAYKTGYLKIVSKNELCAKIRGYYGSGVVNFFVKFPSDESKKSAIKKISGAGAALENR